MDMRYVSGFPNIKDKFTSRKYVLFDSDLFSRRGYFAKQQQIIFLKFRFPFKMFLGHKEKMHRRIWFDIVKPQDLFIFIDRRGRNLLTDNFTKDAIHSTNTHHEFLRMINNMSAKTGELN